MERQQKKTGDEWPERLLVRLAVFLCATLVLSQIMLLNEKPRQYLSKVDRLEGEKISLTVPIPREDYPVAVTEQSAVTHRFQPLRESRVLAVRMVNPAAGGQVWIMINGQNAGRFERGDLSIKVHDGDYVEIDATRLHEPGRFIIKVSGGDVSSPVNGLMLEGSERIIPVGKVKFKD